MNKKIFCGFTGNVDAVTYLDKSLLKRFAGQIIRNKRPVEKPSFFLDSWDDIRNAMLWNITQGSGAEYIITNDQIFNDIYSMNDWNLSAGGTGLQAALAACTAGYNAIVNLPFWSKNYDYLISSKGLTTVTKFKQLAPLHFIFEYNQSDHTGLNINTINSASNRMIFRKSNEFNGSLIAKDFANYIINLNYNNQWMLFSGYNAMETFDELNALIDETKNFLTSLGKQAPPVHLELADVPDIEFQKQITNKLAPFVQSIGLNEDELKNLLSLNDSIFNKEDSDLINCLLKAYNSIGVPSLIVHTYQFSACISKNSSIWREALMNGIKFASAKALTGKYASYEEIVNIRRVSSSHPRGARLAEFTKSNKKVTIVPSQIGKTLSTIGLGDTFTAGLLLKAPRKKEVS